MRRGQGALEYLLLIGGAVLVAGIVLVLLLGVQGSGTKSTQSIVYATQVREMMAMNGAGYWQFDEGSGTSVKDDSGKGLNGTLVNSPQFVPGKFGSGLDVSGASQYIALPAPYLPLGQNWTIAAWFKYPLASGQVWNTLTRGSAIDHQVIVYPPTQHLGSYDNTSTGFNDSGYAMSSLSNGWHHIAAVGQGSTTTFYIDGAEVGSPVNFKSTSDILAIGNYQGGSQAWGTIDEVAIFNRALSDSEIKILASG